MNSAMCRGILMGPLEVMSLSKMETRKCSAGNVMGEWGDGTACVAFLNALRRVGGKRCKVAGSKSERMHRVIPPCS